MKLAKVQFLDWTIAGIRTTAHNKASIGCFLAIKYIKTAMISIPIVKAEKTLRTVELLPLPEVAAN